MNEGHGSPIIIVVIGPMQEAGDAFRIDGVAGDAGQRAGIFRIGAELESPFVVSPIRRCKVTNAWGGSGERQ